MLSLALYRSLGRVTPPATQKIIKLKTNFNFNYKFQNHYLVIVYLRIIINANRWPFPVQADLRRPADLHRGQTQQVILFLLQFLLVVIFIFTPSTATAAAMTRLRR